jgi:hypothetical protein
VSASQAWQLSTGTIRFWLSASVAAHARRIDPERTLKKHPNRYGLTEAKGTIGSLGVDPMEQTGKRSAESLLRQLLASSAPDSTSIQNSEVVFDYMEPPEAFSEELRQLEKKADRTA